VTTPKGHSLPKGHCSENYSNTIVHCRNYGNATTTMIPQRIMVSNLTVVLLQLSEQ